MEKKTLTERVMEAISKNKFRMLKFHVKDGSLTIKRNGTCLNGSSFKLEFHRDGYQSINEDDLSKEGVKLFVQGIAAHHLVDWTQSK